jgi:hypothetical protein
MLFNITISEPLTGSQVIVTPDRVTHIIVVGVATGSAPQNAVTILSNISEVTTQVGTASLDFPTLRFLFRNDPSIKVIYMNGKDPAATPTVKQNLQAGITALNGILNLQNRYLYSAYRIL